MTMTSMNLDDVIERLEGDMQSQYDNTVMVGDFVVNRGANGPEFWIDGKPYDTSTVAVSSVLERLGMSARELKLLQRNEPVKARCEDLFYHNVEERLGIAAMTGEKWFCRFRQSVNGSPDALRAALSEHYTPFSNLDAVLALGEGTVDSGGFLPQNMFLEDVQMTGFFVAPEAAIDLNGGVAMAGLSLYNSEIGHRAASADIRLVWQDPAAGKGVGITFDTDLSKYRQIHYRKDAKVLYDSLVVAVKKTLTNMEGYLYKLRDFAMIKVDDPASVVDVVMADEKRYTQAAVDAVKLSTVNAVKEHGSTGMAVICGIAGAVNYTTLTLEEQLRLESLAARIVNRGRFLA